MKLAKAKKAEECPWCQGSGYVDSVPNTILPCWACGGTGKADPAPAA